ncbi:MAG: phospholipase D-like domain-containing protein [Deinococcus sp.]|uniref:phospholipase D-like domain-containing protein n=1 Tax=Deinococcus sp. TaxID=47478 RepID=UPI0026DC25EF|nr:phospholipase D-like domain-containing protein [Deinococcus sp.]MDO4245850.1 phospholipase D-like domain-containing protein [Deinococcus sp.]
MGDASRFLRWSVAAAAGAGLSLFLLMLVLPGTVQTLAQKQTLLLAFLLVVVAYVCIAAGFALMGALSARSFALSPLGVRPQTGPYRFSVALGVTGGLLVIPTLLLSALGVVSTNGAFVPTLKQWQPLALLLVAGVYGLLSGTLLGFLLLRASQAWRVALAATAGAILGGGVVMALFHLLPVATLIQTRVGIVALLVVGLVILHLGWSWAVGAALAGVARRWAGRPDHPNASARQVWVVATLGLLALLSVSSTTRAVGEFMTSRPVDTSPLALPKPANLPGCPPPAPGLLRRAWDVYTRGGRPDLSCGNRVVELLDMPGSDDMRHIAFQDVGDMVAQARREVLFTTMEYSSGPRSPGRTLTDALARLYAKVKADPAAYPGGMQVALTLGNYPVLSLFEWGAQVWNLLDDLKASGVPLSDPAVGWQVRLGNYAGTYPHSHVKLLVIDGERLVTAGFNYSFVHYPPTPDDKRRKGLFDLALVTDGPAAQDGIAVFDDLWERSKQVSCDQGEDRKHCELTKSTPLRHAEVVHQTRRLTAQNDVRVMSLYRRQGETQANDALLALMNGTQTRLDLMHVNFSMNITCMVALLNPTMCTGRDQLPYLTAVLDALRRGVPVRLLTDPTLQIGALENRIAVGYIRHVMEREGLPLERFQVRLFPVPVHAKATLTDDVLTVGSLNMHYSSWTQGPIGLNEAVATTNDSATLSQFRQMYDAAWAQAEPLELPSP